jgi:hypothetical protein
MRQQHDHREGNRAVALLATCVVVLLGALSCAAIAIAADPQNPRPTLYRAGATMAGIVFLLWMLRERPPENQTRVLWGWLGRRRKRVAYHLRPKLPPTERSSPPQGPPTAESIRAVNSGTSTWVPSSTAPPPRRNTRPGDLPWGEMRRGN